MVLIGHVGDEGAARVTAQAGRLGVIGPRVDILLAGGVDRLSILRKSKTMVQLQYIVSDAIFFLQRLCSRQAWRGASSSLIPPSKKVVVGVRCGGVKMAQQLHSKGRNDEVNCNSRQSIQRENANYIFIRQKGSVLGNRDTRTATVL